MSVTPFRIAIDDQDVEDLKARLRATRFSQVAPNEEFERGPSSAYLHDLATDWADLDWRAAEAELNTLDQVLVEVGGTTLHSIHVRSPRPDAVPIVLLHGWPDTAFRYRHLVPLLAEPEGEGPAFHVVVPSLPGFGFSGRTAANADDTADLVAGLMTELGHERFVVAGGDVGTNVGLALGRRHADRLHGLFLTNVSYPTGQEQDLTEAEREYADYIQGWWYRECAYAMVQSTKPQIVGPALADSPIGMAAFMLGLIETGAEGHDVDGAFGGRHELLVNLSLYWLTNTAASAADTYHAESSTWGGETARVEVPTGVAIFPREAPSPREWCERQADVVRYTRMPRGGHFAALEVPHDLTAELRAFVADL